MKMRLTIVLMICLFASPVMAARKKPAKPVGPPPMNAPYGQPGDDGFVSLFNGKDLTGWVGSVTGYAVEEDAIYCKKGGNLYTKMEFSDFILRFEFQLTAGANNGLGIRAPLKGNAAYAGMELQVLDNTAEKYAKLKDYQYHGSIYGLVPAKRGALKPVGEWNVQEVRAIGRKITVILNGVTIVDADLDKVGNAKHAGIKRAGGHIGFLGHGSRVGFRKLRIKPILPCYEKGPHNVPPEGFTTLFNGKDLTGWRGRPQMSPAKVSTDPVKRQADQDKWNADMAKHWTVVGDAIVNDGGGAYLTTMKDYGDCEFRVDFKMPARADSGVYVRANPQVQIWDTTRAGRKWGLRADRGSGGLWNNKRNEKLPWMNADQPFGKWNRMSIKIIVDKVTVHMNGMKIVDNVVMENFFDRKNPLPATGPFQLQTHGGKIEWRNIFIREIAKEEAGK